MQQCVILENLQVLQMADKEALPLKVIQLDVNDDLSVENAIEEIFLKKKGLIYL
jgi:hypothetical protein